MSMRRYAGVLPYARRPDGSVVFLLGFETKNVDKYGWSDFGGGIEAGETAMEAAAREASEESMGMLGTKSALLKQLRGVKPLKLVNSRHYLLPVVYDEQMPQWFGRFYLHLRGHFSDKTTPRGILEKTKVAWMSLAEMRAVRLRRKFRPILPLLNDNDEVGKRKK